MPQNAGDVSAIVTIVGLVFSLLGITGIDASVVSSAVTGVIALVSVGTAIHAYYTRA